MPKTAIAPDVAAEIARWLGPLGAERRMSPKTLEAYERDVSQFLGFLTGHLGHPPSLKHLAGLTPADIRAFMAARRADGLGNRSLMRVLAGARSFARYLERNGKGKVGALAAVRTPKPGRTLPKPLPASAARRLADTGVRAGESYVDVGTLNGYREALQLLQTQDPEIPTEFEAAQLNDGLKPLNGNPKRRDPQRITGGHTRSSDQSKGGLHG